MTRAPEEGRAAGEREDGDAPGTILEMLARSPVATGSLFVFVVAGAMAAWLLFEEVSLARRVLGGALLGFVGWLVLHFRRLFE